MNEGEYLKEMGRKIKSIRNKKNLSQRELGKLCNLNASSICRIESGQETVYLLTLKHIAEKLDIDMKEFL